MLSINITFVDASRETSLRQLVGQHSSLLVFNISLMINIPLWWQLVNTLKCYIRKSIDTQSAKR